MMFQLLAESGSKIPAELIIFILVSLFSFLKWLMNQASKDKKHKGTSQEEPLGDLYDVYHEEIIQRQSAFSTPPETTTVEVVTSPSLVEEENTTTDPSQSPRFTQEDIERARTQNLHTSAYTLEPTHKKTSPHFNNKNKLLSQLKHKNSLRQALIVREILGPPKSLETSK